MSKKLNTLMIMAGILVSMATEAVIITGELYTAEGKKVSLQGLEWLSLDHTAGFSRKDIEDGFTDHFGNIWDSSDWRYATRAETESLLGSLWGGTWQGASKAWQSSNYDGANWFINSFQGLSYDYGYGVNREDGKYTLNPSYRNLDSSEFFFGSQAECNFNYDFTCYGLVQVADQHYLSNQAGKTGWLHEAYGLNVPNTSNQNISTTIISSQSYRGSLLVRDAQVNIEVPESGSLALIALGLFGLIARRRLLFN